MLIIKDVHKLIDLVFFIYKRKALRLQESLNIRNVP